MPLPLIRVQTLNKRKIFLKEAFTNVRLRRNFGFRKIAVRVFSEHRNVFWWRYSWFSTNFESSGILDVCKITQPIPLEYHVISFEIPRGFSKILCGNENSDIQLISRTIWVMLNEWSLRMVHLKLGDNLEAEFGIYRFFLAPPVSALCDFGGPQIEDEILNWSKSCFVALVNIWTQRIIGN